MSPPAPVLEVLSAGALTTVQDVGRPGLAHLGVPRSGAADRPAAALANRLVGNPPGAAVLEVTGGGLVLTVRTGVAVALTGADGPITVDDLPVRTGAPVLLRPGSVLAVGTPGRGLRTYVGVRGGIDVPAVLGSRSYDMLSRLGPPPLHAGQVLGIGPPPAEPPQDPVDLPPPPTPAVLEVLPGPRPEWFAPEALAVLCASAYQVSDQSRVGVRLAGAQVPWADDVRPASEGAVDGAVQIPPDGCPVLFLADHPVTGGYPVIAVLTETSLAAAAQLRPGDPVRFRPAARGPVGGRH